MKWYSKLYMGESIANKSEKIKWKIRHNAGQLQIYVISLANCEGNLLDIIPSVELMQKGYPKKDLVIIGLAKGWDEAVEVAASIVLESFENTGSFDVKNYINGSNG